MQVRWRGKNHTLSIPLVVINEELSPVLRRGAYIQKYEQYLDVRVTSGNVQEIPSVLEVDADGLMVGDKLGVDRIVLPPGIEVIVFESDSSDCFGCYYDPNYYYYYLLITTLQLYKVATPDMPFKSGQIMARVVGKKSLNALIQ